MALSKKERKKVKTLIDQGMSCFHEENYQEAIASFDKVIEIDPLNEEIWLLRCISHSQIGNKREAIKSGETAVLHFPENANLWFFLGNEYFMIDDIKDSLRCIEETLFLDPDNQNAKQLHATIKDGIRSEDANIPI